MYTITFVFSDKREEDYEHIEKVEYQDFGGKNSVSGDEIFTYKFPLSYDFHLFSKNKSYIISPQGLVKIEVTKED